jgi:hypothetical protein
MVSATHIRFRLRLEEGGHSLRVESLEQLALFSLQHDPEEVPVGPKSQQ